MKTILRIVEIQQYGRTFDTAQTWGYAYMKNSRKMRKYRSILSFKTDISRRILQPFIDRLNEINVHKGLFVLNYKNTDWAIGEYL